MKKICLLLVLVFMMSCMTAVFAEEPQISVFVNTERVIFPDQQPMLVSDRTLVPLRAIFEAYGCMVEWNNGVAYAACAMPGRIRLLQIAEGKNEIVIRDYTIEDGKEKSVQTSVSLDVPAQNINSRIMVPLRAISEALDAEVIWNGITASANIFYDKDSIISLEQQNAYIKKNYVKVQHILLENSSHGKGKAEIIIDQVTNEGFNFEALMYEHNLDGGVARYPEGYIFAKGEIGDKTFENAAFGLKEGAITKRPVKSAWGYHVIYRVPFTAADYEEVRLEVMQKLALGQ